jgi:hypothetical protein
LNKFKHKYIIIIICSASTIIALLIAGIFFFHTNSLDNNNSSNKEEMLKTTLEWGRLAPLPDSRSDFNIQTEGNAFTRSFRSSFYLSKEDLDSWIKKSPGLQDAQIEIVNTTTKKYIINPGGGAEYAEAVIDFDKCNVQIYTYWS